MKNISFVILTWNRSKMLKLCLSRLHAVIKNKDECEIIILDNASSDNTKDVINEFKNEKTDIKITTIFSRKNTGLNGYKKLFSKAKAKYIVEVDDDVLDFPDSLDHIFDTYMSNFPEYGYLALDVIQNEHTDGAKPGAECYTEVERNGMVIENGPTGGWCSCFRKEDFKKTSILFDLFHKFDFKNGEDGYLCRTLRKRGKKFGIIKGVKCFHASGPYYSREFQQLDRDIMKYEDSGLDTYVKKYKEYR
ncbi:MULTISPECIES: glycosyltransferase family 2 protein [unclassified Brenneria]|uniref:glycosyltransferase family 2 protein n=1 Tax=unclassified Brenneria TaxID=2634434 RepID=UPI0018F0945C|nr:glycosyltransferase [Brenneria sp. L3-3C-1]MBJ7223401.1 glycosyltransferase family 2 protein [Brenneria sp. L3-3C-1]MEE3644641.1 glycosyltransferase [Brenneria sp. L3_3C_1]